MKRLIMFTGLICATLLLSGCGNSDSSYYCESSEHELRGKTCVIKDKTVKNISQPCPSGSYHDNTGGGYCVTERTYDALEK